MKRLLALAAACFVALSLFAVSAHADFISDCGQAQYPPPVEADCDYPDPEIGHNPPSTHHGIHCEIHKRWNQQHTQSAFRTVCPLVNSQDIPSFGENIEALLDYERGSNPGNHVKIYVDWIRLLRSNGEVLKDFNCDCWKDTDNSGSMSTGWYDSCLDNPHIYSAKARYKIQWLTLPGQPIGTFKIQESDDVNWVPC